MKYSFINEDYQRYDEEFKPNHQRKGDFSAIKNALLELEEDGEKIHFFEHFPCRSKLKEFINKKGEMLYTAITQNSQKCIIKDELKTPIPLYYNCDPYNIIENLNKNGFIIYWDGSSESALIIMTEEIEEQLEIRYRNYNYNERDIDYSIFSE